MAFLLQSNGRVDGLTMCILSDAYYFFTFRGMLKEAYKKRMLKENINDFLDRIPEEETEINYLTEHELGLIINNECPIPVLRKAIIFACITGFRRSDILALKWEDIKELPKGGWCVFKRMQKTKNMANVPIGDDLMEVIGPRGEGLVFNGLTTYMLTYPMKRWFKSIGIKKDLHFHCTRHRTYSYILKIKSLQDLFFRQVTVWKRVDFFKSPAFA